MQEVESRYVFSGSRESPRQDPGVQKGRAPNRSSSERERERERVRERVGASLASMPGQNDRRLRQTAVPALLGVWSNERCGVLQGRRRLFLLPRLLGALPGPAWQAVGGHRVALADGQPSLLPDLPVRRFVYTI